MPFYERGDVRIHYEEAGSGFPLLLIPGGGLNSTISFLTGSRRSTRWRSSSDEYRCITMDLRNANGGQSSGPLEIDRPWDAYTDDQLGLMDHLGIKEFLVMGFCIGGPFIWNLLKRAPDRVVAAVLAQPSGFRPEIPDLFYNNNIKGWGPALCARRPDITMEMVDAFLKRMYRRQPRLRLHRDARFRAQLPDADPGAAGRRPGASVRGGDGDRASRAECGGQHLSVEGAQGADSAGVAPRAHFPAGRIDRLENEGRATLARAGAVTVIPVAAWRRTSLVCADITNAPQFRTSPQHGGSTFGTKVAAGWDQRPPCHASNGRRACAGALTPRLRSVCSVTSGGQLNWASIALVPTPFEV